ncbi:molybdate ABC transporter substrate-binding protein [Tumebacillus algifaecis]|uniref:Molybdate ABC transporter substrate-binding protein n=1 Tax=Tumebacillus algifaecis TaxID=1214604 RepID=A0A223D3C3_9BACL|nr:molybdate ABC transporter substrate-binding protein [Tumebacillus algifaecis]ASS75897.1 molybdate ABC transporter substrate-binding protein [Tumebacillus algifaecis]
MKKSWLLLPIAGLLALGCATAEPVVQKEEIILSAAASLAEPLETIKANFEKEHKDVAVTINLGASGTLQKQIEQGAPADLFWSAGKGQMDALEKQGLLVDGTRRDAAVNRLVLIVPSEGKQASALTSLADLAKPDINKIGLGTPETVPAGKYAQEALTHEGVWDVVQPKGVFGKDVKQVLTYVERGDVDAGIVYRSDALSSNKVKIAVTAPEASHSPIVYPLAVLKQTKHQEKSQKLLDYLTNEQSQAILEKAGFDKK